ncbi:hypothetical protein BUALT_Bualt05G0066400 [Buddleja alternifolia]|uniref:Growth-regulating factor n=1 Tax=Buddleja alternifolia TaxID=168488 RepID=A0AAV6XP10_9LAMI|nr:hypothetical protein BUALT_Bualt05G0066400 [Buddleja alternifolia]
MEAESPPSKISRITHNGKAASESVNCGFTFMQLQELKQQSQIYNYMEAGIPIPSYLILPIWRSFARSHAQQLYPNFFGSNPLYCDPKSSIDSDPERCRRRDGKKWRCSKNVVQGQKYCHSHMHRGRHRLKNDVEPPKTIISSNNNNETCSLERSSVPRIPVSTFLQTYSESYNEPE